MTDRQTTHWEGCHTKHLDCALARIDELEADKARLGDVAAEEGMRLFRDAWSALNAQVGSEAANVLSTMPGWGARMRRALAADMKHTD